MLEYVYDDQGSDAPYHEKHAAHDEEDDFHGLTLREVK